MKHYSFFVAAFAALAMLVSCNKESKDGPSVPGSVNEPAVSVVYSFPEGSGIVRSVEFSDGLYVARLDPATRAGSAAPVFVSGTYTYSKMDRTYTMQGFGSMSVDDMDDDGNAEVTLRINYEGVRTQSSSATVTTTEAQDSNAGVCGAWSVRSTLVSASKGSLAASHQFDGCMPAAMVEYFSRKGFDMSAAARVGDLALYAVEKVAFTPEGTFVICFGEAEPYVGVWSWKDSRNGLFSYDLTVSGKNGIILARKSQGTLKQDGDNLLLAVSAYYGGMDLSATLTLVR